MQVTNKNHGDFWFTGVYIRPCSHMKAEAYQKLTTIADNMFSPWIVTGDFNDIAAPSEKRGGRPASDTRCSRLRNWLDLCGLIDLGMQGGKFTWKGARRLPFNRVYERLDRAVCNVEWRLKYVEARVRALPRVSCDHNPILIDIDPRTKGPIRESLFRFQAAWLTHRTFPDEGELERGAELGREQCQF